MLDAGLKPTTDTSPLSGLSQELYDNRIAENIIPPESAIITEVDGTDYPEPEDQRQDRVFKAKIQAWVDASSLVNHIVTNGEINDISSIIDTSLATAVPAPTDGGLALKTSFSASLQANNLLQKGTIS